MIAIKNNLLKLLINFFYHSIHLKIFFLNACLEITFEAFFCYH